MSPPPNKTKVCKPPIITKVKKERERVREKEREREREKERERERERQRILKKYSNINSINRREPNFIEEQQISAL